MAKKGLLQRLREAIISDDVECPECDGKGYVYDDLIEPVECNLCNGTCYVSKSDANDYNQWNIDYECD